MVAKNEGSDKVIKTERLEVRGKTLVFDNTIIQTINVSSIELGELKKALPKFIWGMLILGGLLFIWDSDVRGLSIVIWIIAGALYYNWYNDKEFGLIIRLNSGFTQLIKSENQEFLKNVAIVLKNIMDGKDEQSITFNLDQRTIVDNVSGSTVVVGNATGDIVNRV